VPGKAAVVPNKSSYEKNQDVWPKFFVVGAARSNTTSLHRYPNHHRNICIMFERTSLAFEPSAGF
jgi:hypothetical protein